MNIIETTGLTKKFVSTTAVDGLNLEIGQGIIYGLIGPDGAGKTTTLRLFAGIMDADSGTAAVNGISLPEGSEEIKETTGYMPQKFSLYTDLTVGENIRFFADIYGINEDELKTRSVPLLKMTRLEPFKDRLAGNLSGGMKQKLALMCTLIHRPKLLLLDEPTTGVDPVSRREFWEILQQILSEGVSIVAATPYMDEAEWCARVGLMYNGRLVKEGTPAALKAGLNGLVAEVEGDIDENELALVQGVVDVSTYGTRHRVIINDKGVFETLNAGFGSRAKVRQARPGIEDVFVNTISSKT